MNAIDQQLATALHRFLCDEQAAGADDLHEIWSLPIATRLDEGDALQVDGQRGWSADGKQLTLIVRRNDSRFRNGDELHLGSGLHPASAPLVIYGDYHPAAAELTVTLPPYGADRAAIDEQLRQPGPWILDRAAVDTTAILLRALGKIYSDTHEPRAAAARDLLAGRFDLRRDSTQQTSAATALERLAARGTVLNAAQRDAFAAAWANRPCHLVQGPPGTGKTWLLAKLVAALAWRGESILVSAATHAAVDNAMQAIADLSTQMGAPLRLVRVRSRQAGIGGAGSIQTVSSVRQLPQARRGLVVGATVLSTLALADQPPFSRVVFDEAAQIPLSHALAPLLAAGSWTLFGDDQQLGPVTVADHRDNPAATSLFAHLRALVPPTLLTETHRLNDEICRFPSNAFYDGRLQPTPCAASRRLSLAVPIESDPEGLFAAQPAALLLRVDHEGCQSFAPAEARAASSLAATLLTLGQLPATQLAIISPFRRQNREIATRLRGLLPLGAELPTIDTVERVQGQERDVVIVSLTCSDPDALRRDSGFFFSAPRLNVSLTRARRKLIVIASRHLLTAFPATVLGLQQIERFHRLFQALPQRDGKRFFTDVNCH